ncbi:ABC transporter ATP-binding protein [Microbacterium sp. CCNWLW134]|uniref:ABC transporter ATP-binding protein n=1 Tax=Microbacterium sp. CCNWLW134 TaxID=3122064 RepID=UPI00300FE82B
MTLLMDTQHRHDSAPTAPVIRVSGLTMTYGTRRVLDGIDLEIGMREKIAILGPNGAGKSTLVETLEGIRRPSSGEVTVLGEVPSTAPEAWKSRIGIVLQSWRDHGTWRVIDILRYVAAGHRTVGRDDLRDPAEMLAAVGLADRSRQLIRTLSGGQRRRLDVACALISRPDVLFLDEPTTGFDPSARRSFHELMDSIAETTTIIWATHDLSEAQRMCDRILVLDGGAIVADGSPDDLRAAMAGRTTVTWRDGEGRHSREVDDPRTLLAALSADPSAVDVEVRRGTLEDAYLAIVARAEASDQSEQKEAS